MIKTLEELEDDILDRILLDSPSRSCMMCGLRNRFCTEVSNFKIPEESLRYCKSCARAHIKQQMNIVNLYVASTQSDNGWSIYQPQVSMNLEQLQSFQAAFGLSPHADQSAPSERAARFSNSSRKKRGRSTYPARCLAR